ncbi:MAG: DUF2934 domain-containing protein [Rubrivivax sp.]
MKHPHATASNPKTVTPKPAVAPAIATTMAESAAPLPSASGDTKDEFIRQTAYCYFEARGRIGGHELDDWLKAEAEFERLRTDGTPASDSTTATH